MDYSSSEAVEAARSTIRRPWRGSLAPVGFEGVSHSCFSPVWRPREVNLGDSGPLLSPRRVSNLLLYGKECDKEEYRGMTVHGDVMVESGSSEVYRCPVCLGELIEPTTLVGCQHSYCFPCISLWFSHSYSVSNETKFATVCPLCKAPAAYFLRFVEGNVKVYAIHNDDVGCQTRNGTHDIGSHSKDRLKAAALVCWSIKRSGSER